jgi:hypothetical protein
VPKGRNCEGFKADDVGVTRHAAVVEEARVVKQASLVLFHGVNDEHVVEVS